MHFQSFRALGSCSHCAHSSTTRPFPGRFPRGADAMAFSFVDSSRLRCHEHTFVAFIDIKEAFDSSPIFPLWYTVPGPSWWLRLSTLGRLWHCASRILSLLLFKLLIDSLAVTLRSAIPGLLRCLLTPSVTFASSMLMTSSFSPLPKLTFSWPSMPCMLGVLALLLWCWSHQIRHYDLRSSARPP